MLLMPYSCFNLRRNVSEQQLTALASFVYDAYSPEGIQIHSIPELRLYLFCKHVADSDRLLQQWETENHLQRLHVQARVRSGKRRSSEADWPIADRIHWRRWWRLEFWNHSLQISCQPQQLSVKWRFVTARETAHRKNLAVNHRTCLVLIYVYATTTAKLATMCTLMMIQMAHF